MQIQLKIMMKVYLIIVHTFWVFVTAGDASRGGLCSVYDPFKVQPDNNKYQVGGAFPLHDTDCIWLQPETVQDIVAIQWALTHWNQNPENNNTRMGLYAGDTCSRPKEAISQSLRFLDSVGYHEPDECANPQKQHTSKLLGLISPKDNVSSRALGALLKSASIPVAAYSSSSADSLTYLNLKNVITTAPTLTVFIEAFMKLMTSMRSNLVSIVDNGKHKEAISRIIQKVRSSGIYVSEVISIKDPSFETIITETDSEIILSYIDKRELFEVISRKDLSSLNKMWISIAADGDGLSSEEQLSVLQKGTRLQIVSLQPRHKDFPQFRDYFLRVLKNNYQSYSLLTTYVQQVFNCSVVGTDGFVDCASLERDQMAAMYAQAGTVESAIRMTYAFAGVGSRLEANSEAQIACERPTTKCTELIMSELELLDYEFGMNDPSELAGERLQFYRNSDNLLISNGIIIEGIELFNDEQMGPMVSKIIEYETGRKPRLVTNNYRQTRIRSLCAPYRPFCGQCEHPIRVDSQKYFLSIPKQYPLYVAGLFDFHDGPGCQSFRNSDISLPMAFVHTIWTFRQRYPQLHLLHNLDFGALLVDTCSLGRRAIEIVVQSENQCITFEQANRNITLVPGSIFGYVSAINGQGHEALRGLFVSGEAPLVALDSERNPSSDEFSTMPSGKYQALALLKLLKKLNWEFVSVILSEQDSPSLASFRHFERMAPDRGICLAEVINMSGEHVPDLSASSSTNVTVLFTTADDAANYFSARLRRDSSLSHVHVVVGDAHDFYLRDGSNIAKYVGTVSLQPKDVLYSDFRQWLEMTTPLTLPEAWYWKHIENRWQCALAESNRNLYSDKMCTGDELLDVPSLGRMTKSGYLSRGVERFLFAMDAVYKKLCPEQTGICAEFYSNGRKQILSVLKKTRIEDDFDIYEFLPDQQGSFSYQNIGNWSIKAGLRFKNAYKNFDSRGVQISSENVFSQRIVSRCVPPLCTCFADKDLFTRPVQLAVPSNEDAAILSGSYIRREPANGALRKVQYSSVFEHLTSGQWRSHVWNYGFLLAITALLIGALAVLVLVCVKLYLRVVKGNQSLGISLLIGVIILYITSYLFVFDATDVICRMRVIMHSMGYALCFGVMIAKATQLRNAETLGFANAVHISYWNYWLLLFFILGVQIALSVRWLAEQFLSSLVMDGSQLRMMCTYGDKEFLLSQAYVIVLLVLALFLNSRNRNIKRNYKETKWLFLSSVVCVVLWALWMTTFMFVPTFLKDTVVVVELLSCATVLLGFLFGPKIYILLSYEPVVVEYHAQNGPAKDGLFEKGLFERDENVNRAVSPASSTGSGTQSTACGTQRSSNSGVHSSSSGACSDDQVPIFYTVMRKKNRVRRTRSEHNAKPAQITQHSSMPSTTPSTGGARIVVTPNITLSPPYTNTNSIHRAIHKKQRRQSRDASPSTLVSPFPE